MISGYTYKITEIQILKRCLHIHVHCSFIHSSQEVEAPKCPLIKECPLNKGNESYTYNGILLSLKNNDICYNLENIGLSDVSHHKWTVTVSFHMGKRLSELKLSLVFMCIYYQFFSIYLSNLQAMIYNHTKICLLTLNLFTSMQKL